MKLKTRWLITCIVFLLPFISVLIPGLYWLWLNHFFVVWLTLTATLGLAWWFFSYRRTVASKGLKHTEAISSTNREIDNDPAWRKIAAISSRITHSNPDIGDPRFYIDTVEEIMRTVAGHYHPEQKDAFLEIRIPYLLAVIELVAKDLRIGFAENIPASHIITLRDIVRGRRLATQGAGIYRLLRLVVNISPAAELASAAGSKLYTETYEDIKAGLIDAFIKKSRLLCHRVVQREARAGYGSINGACRPAHPR